MDRPSVAEAYDRNYATPNFFRDRPWLLRPYVRALIARAELPRQAALLDAGCGQGLFTSLFAEHGIHALGVDLSSVGIASARSTYATSSAKFEIGDVLHLPYEGMFDCVFTRSCSLYNNDDFAANTSVTEQLMRYLKPGGVLIFDYYTRLASERKSASWRYHTLEEAHGHFARFSGAMVRFSTRIECRVLGRFAFGSGVSRVAAALSRATGVGGELIGFVRADAT
jgi:SAM-dependent methyltransferase